MFDLDPSYPLGIDKTDLEFAHIMMIYLLSKTDREFTAQQQIKALSDHKNAALICPAPELINRGMAVLDEMEKYPDVANTDNVNDILAAIKKKKETTQN